MNFAKVAKKIVKQCRVDNPRHFKLDDHDPAETFGLSTSIGDVEAILAQGIARIIDLQQRLYAHGQWAVLLVFQGMDAAGKDGVVKHVMSGINPQGCEVHAFKAPSSEELEHDFLWRTGRDVPARGRIGIFNRSHYEEVLVVRVHPEMLERQNLPPAATGKDIWKHRFKEIRAFERHLTRNGTLVLKFHLRISKDEQRKRNFNTSVPLRAKCCSNARISLKRCFQIFLSVAQGGRFCRASSSGCTRTTSTSS